MPPARTFQLVIHATLEDTDNKGLQELAAQARQAVLGLPARVADPQVHVAWVGISVKEQWATGQCSCGWRSLNRFTEDERGRWVDTDHAQADLDAHLRDPGKEA